MICLICRTRLLVYDVREYYCIQQNPICLPHHETFESLIQSIEAGCFICNRLWATLGSGERNSAGKPIPLSRRRTIEIFSQEAAPCADMQPLTLLRIRQRSQDCYRYYIDIACSPRTSKPDPPLSILGEDIQSWDALFSLQVNQGMQPL